MFLKLRLLCLYCKDGQSPCLVAVIQNMHTNSLPFQYRFVYYTHCCCVTASSSRAFFKWNRHCITVSEVQSHKVWWGGWILSQLKKHYLNKTRQLPQTRNASVFFPIRSDLEQYNLPFTLTCWFNRNQWWRFITLLLFSTVSGI